MLVVTRDAVFASLGNQIRRELLQLLAEGPRNASSLAAEFELSRPAVAEHLQLLEKAGLVVAVKRGRERHYHLNPEPLAAVSDWLQPFERYWRDRLSDLAQITEEDNP